MVDYKTKSERVVDAAMKDGMKGLLYGLAGSTVASLALQKYCTLCASNMQLHFTKD